MPRPIIRLRTTTVFLVLKVCSYLSIRWFGCAFLAVYKEKCQASVHVRPCTPNTCNSLGESIEIDLVCWLMTSEGWVQWVTQDSQRRTGTTSLFHWQICVGISGPRGWARSYEYKGKQALPFWAQYVPERRLLVVGLRAQHSARYAISTQ